jgi:prophage regulatory protein
MHALTLPDVCEKTGLRRSFLYELIKRGEFPSPAKIGKRSVFSSDEVDAFLRARFDARPRVQGGAK